MPFFFTCPKCQRKNYGYQFRPEGDSYYDELQCTRCGQKDIFWVETQALADRVGGTGTRKQIAIGVGESPIGYMDPEVATGTLEQRILPRFNPVATLVAPYNQGKRIKAFTPNVTQIQEGVCAGQCLHWIRRVLQGGRDSYMSPVVKGSVTRTDEELSRKHKKQHLVGAKTQLLLEQHKTTTLERLSAARRQLHAQNQSRLDETDRRIEAFLRARGIIRNGTSWRINYSSQEEWTEKERLLDTAMAKRDEILEKMNEDVAKLNEITSKGFFANGWEQLARDLDQNLDSLGGSSRKYGNILAVRCVDRTDTPYGNGTPAAFARGIVGDSEFVAGRAAILSLGLGRGIGEAGGSISGHAIAVHFTAPGELFLFDPNLGIFRSQSKDHLRRTLEILLGPVWQQDLTWQLNGTFGFAIFRAAEQPSDRRPLERVVNYETEVPEVTTSQNRAIGTMPTVPDVQPEPIQTVTTSPPVTNRFAPQSQARGGDPSTGAPRGTVADRIRQFGS